MVWPPVLQPLCLCWSREGGNLLALAAFSGAARSGLRAVPARVSACAGCPWAPLCCTAFQGYWAREGEHRCANPHLFQSKSQRLLHFLPGSIPGSCMCCSCTLWRLRTLQACWTELHSSPLCRVAGLLAAD